MTTDIEQREQLAELQASAERYAGWLTPDRSSASIKSHLLSLAGAVRAGNDATPWFTVLAADLRRLPQGGIRGILRRVLDEMATLLNVVVPVQERAE